MLVGIIHIKCDVWNGLIAEADVHNIFYGELDNIDLTVRVFGLSPQTVVKCFIKENCGNECAGVSDTDPPHEVRNVPCPHHRMHVSPDPDTRANQIGDQRKTHHHRRETDAKRNPPP